MRRWRNAAVNISLTVPPHPFVFIGKRNKSENQRVKENGVTNQELLFVINNADADSSNSSNLKTEKGSRCPSEQSELSVVLKLLSVASRHLPPGRGRICADAQ